jgi:cytochrome c biogenesis protein CcmG/thiol:disulfide interchange protein DsbE
MRPVFAGVMAGLVVSLLLLFLLLVSLPPGPITRATAPPPPTIPVITPPTLPSVGSPSPSATLSPSPSSPGSGDLQVGSLAPPLKVARLGGGEIDRAQLTGTPLWVNFTATWCPTCRDELRLLERYQAALKGKLTVVVIDVREPQEVIAALVRDLGVTLPVGLDTTGAAQRDWAAYVLPLHYWVDATGHIRAWVYGGAGPEQFATGLHSVLPDANVDIGS